jgi:hypothetical protein
MLNKEPDLVSVEGRKLERCEESVMPLDGSVHMPGSTAADERILGELSVTVFAGAAAVNAIEFNRQEAAIHERRQQQHRSSPFRPGSLDDRLRRLGVI